MPLPTPLLPAARGPLFARTFIRCGIRRPKLGRSIVRVRAESPLIEEVAGRRINAPVFNRTRWAYHQDTGRYARHLQSIFRSVTFKHLQAPLSFLTLVSCLVVAYRTLVDAGELPDVFQGVTFTDVPFQLTSFALSLLLVFRTDASYARWSSALDSWGTLRSATSQLVRKAAAWVDQPAALQRLVRWVVAFPLCLMVELRHDQGDPGVEAAMREQLSQVLRPHEVDQVASSGPYYHQLCLSVLTALIEACQLGESRESSMLEDLNGFNQAASECEKLLRFPIPLTYTRHTSRFMLIYLAALPLALYDSCDWAVIPVTVVISFLLLGIEDIGVQIEEPFAILPLPEVCADLRHVAERALAQRSMVRCLADPDTCPFDPEDAVMVTGVGRARLGARELEEAEEEAETGGERVLAGASLGGGGGNGNGAGGAGLSSGAGAGVQGLGARGASYGYSNGNGAGLVAAVADANGNGNGHVSAHGHGGHGSGYGGGHGNGNGKW